MVAVLALVDAVDVCLPIGVGAGFQQFVDDVLVAFRRGPQEGGFLRWRRPRAGA
jgi:hypothetical protein